MGWSEQARSLARFEALAGGTTLASQLSLWRAYERWQPGVIRHSGHTMIDVRTGEPADFQEDASRPGLWVMPLSAPSQSGREWVYRDGQIPAPLLRDVTPDTLERYAGKPNVDAMRAISELWRLRVYGKGIVAPDEERIARAGLESGVLVYLRPHESRPPAWNKAGEAFIEAMRSYRAASYERAKRQAEAAARSAEFWTAVYDLTKATSELPQRAAGLAVSGVGKLLAANPIIAAGLAAAVGGAIWWRSGSK